MQKTLTVLAKALFFASLLFAFNFLPGLPWGSGKHYMLYLCLPLALLFCCFAFKKTGFPKALFRGICFRLKPFVPFLLSVFLLYLFYWGQWEGFEIQFSSFLEFTLSAGIVFAVLSLSGFRPSLSWVFCACGAGCACYFAEVLFIWAKAGCPLIELRDLVHPYCTVLARSVSYISGVAFLGFFICRNLPLAGRIFLLGAGLAGFFTGAVLLQTGGIAFTFCLSLFVACVYFYRDYRKFWLITIPTVLTVCVLAIGLTSVGSRFEEGLQQLSSVPSQERIEQVLAKLKQNTPLTSEEDGVRRAFNSNVGARIAAWTLGTDIIKDHPLIGTGEGAFGSHIPVKELFKYSRDYLPHFHSDYIEAGVIGGMLLLCGLLGTEILLLLRAIQYPAMVFLLGAAVFSGFYDLGFLQFQSLTTWLGAWFALDFIRVKEPWGWSF